jgi:hypothetical protein
MYCDTDTEKKGIPGEEGNFLQFLINKEWLRRKNLKIRIVACSVIHATSEFALSGMKRLFIVLCFYNHTLQFPYHNHP